MNIENLLPYIVSVVLTLFSGFGSYIMSNKKAKENIKNMQVQNQLEIERLMNQHKLDIESIEKQHKLNLEKIEKEHQHKIEIMQKEHENSLIRKEKEIEDTAKYGAMKDFMGGTLGELMKGAMNNDTIKKEFEKRIAESFSK